MALFQNTVHLAKLDYRGGPILGAYLECLHGDSEYQRGIRRNDGHAGSDNSRWLGAVSFGDSTYGGNTLLATRGLRHV